MDDAFYTCPYCKEEYSNPVDLAHCILSCEDKRRREEEDRKRVELALEKEARKKDVDDALSHCATLLKEYMKDFGTYSLGKNMKDECTLSRLLPWWF